MKVIYLEKSFFLLTVLLILSCNILAPYTSDSSGEGSAPELGKLYLYMSDEVKEFIDSTPAPTAFKNVIHIISATAIYKDCINTFSNVKMNLHGESGLRYKRKSLELKLPEKICLFNHPDIVKEFFINSLSQDTGYINNFIGYSFLSEQELFFSHFEFIQVYINSIYQGLYLLVEKSQDAIRATHNNIAAVYRKNYGPKFYPKYLDSELPEDCDKYFRDRLLALYSLDNNYDGKELLDSINNILDFDSYCKWLSMNTLLMNGDYLDEVFFYGKKENSIEEVVFKVAGWDYDDIFQPPHDGHSFENSLLYCDEDSFDVTIDKDQILYSEFKKNFKYLLTETITEDFIDSVKEELERILLPQFSDRPTALIMNNFSSSPQSAKNELEFIINERFSIILSRRDSILSVLP